MRKDWDYVEFADYKNDMKELSDMAVRAISLANERAKKAERMLALVVLTSGRVTIDFNLLSDPGKIELITERNDCDMTYRLTAIRT